MKSSTTKLIAALVALGLPTVAVAKNGGNGGNHAFSNSFKSGISSAVRTNVGTTNSVKTSSPVQFLAANNNNGNNGNKNKDVAKGIGIVLATAIANNNLRNGGNGNCHNGNNGNGGGCNNNNNGCNNNNNGGCNNGNVNGDINGDGIPDNVNFAGQAYEPFHSSYVTLPGDSFYTVSLKEYGTSKNARYIAQYNRLAESAALVPGMTLQLPAISVNGQLSASHSPPAETLQSSTTNQVTEALSTGTPATLASATTPAVDTTPRPKVTVGSTLLVDGQTFGDKQGTARLRVGGATLKIEVVEWTNSAVKIRLPQLDLDSATNADIEVVKADGTLAAKTGIELNTGDNVALAQ